MFHVNWNLKEKNSSIGPQIASIFWKNTLEFLKLQLISDKKNCPMSQFQVHSILKSPPIALNQAWFTWQSHHIIKRSIGSGWEYVQWQNHLANKGVGNQGCG
jgi:hypothetical protein